MRAVHVRGLIDTERENAMQIDKQKAGIAAKYEAQARKTRSEQK